jgi:hypothetical protein
MQATSTSSTAPAAERAEAPVLRRGQRLDLGDQRRGQQPDAVAERCGPTGWPAP